MSARHTPGHENVRKCTKVFYIFWAILGWSRSRSFMVVHAHLWSFTRGSRWFTLVHATPFQKSKKYNLSQMFVCYHREPPWTTVNHREPPWTAVNRREPWTSIIHREPPWTAVNHREPPWTTVKHREPAYHNMAYTCTQNIFLSLCWSDLCILWYPRGRQALWIIKTAFVKHGFMMLYRHWSS